MISDSKITLTLLAHASEVVLKDELKLQNTEKNRDKYDTKISERLQQYFNQKIDIKLKATIEALDEYNCDVNLYELVNALINDTPIETLPSLTKLSKHKS